MLGGAERGRDRGWKCEGSHIQVERQGKAEKNTGPERCVKGRTESDRTGEADGKREDREAHRERFLERWMDEAKQSEKQRKQGRS